MTKEAREDIEDEFEREANDADIYRDTHRNEIDWEIGFEQR